MRLSHGGGGHAGSSASSFDVVGASTVTSVQVLQSTPLESAATAAKLMAQFLMTADQEKNTLSSSSIALSYQLDDLWQVAESMAMTATTTTTTGSHSPILTEIRKMRQKQNGQQPNSNYNEKDSFQDKIGFDVAKNFTSSSSNHKKDDDTNDSSPTSSNSSSEGKQRKRKTKERSKEKEEKRAAKRAKKKERKQAKKEQKRQKRNSS
jgi:hypothetical protein